MMVQSAKLLEKARVDFIIIPCVTAHFYHAKLQEQISTPILHIIKETMKHLMLQYPDTAKVGLLASSGTVYSGLFDEACRRKRGVDHNQGNPDSKGDGGNLRHQSHRPLGNSRTLAREAAETLILSGAQAIIAGCTEIPLVLVDGDLSVPVIDPIAVLAERAVMEAR